VAHADSAASLSAAPGTSVDNSRPSAVIPATLFGPRNSHEKGAAAARGAARGAAAVGGLDQTNPKKTLSRAEQRLLLSDKLAPPPSLAVRADSFIVPRLDEAISGRALVELHSHLLGMGSADFWVRRIMMTYLPRVTQYPPKPPAADGAPKAPETVASIVAAAAEAASAAAESGIAAGRSAEEVAADVKAAVTGPPVPDPGAWWAKLPARDKRIHFDEALQSLLDTHFEAGRSSGRHQCDAGLAYTHLLHAAGVIEEPTKSKRFSGRPQLAIEIPAALASDVAARVLRASSSPPPALTPYAQLRALLAECKDEVARWELLLALFTDDVVYSEGALCDACGITEAAPDLRRYQLECTLNNAAAELSFSELLQPYVIYNARENQLQFVRGIRNSDLAERLGAAAPSASTGHLHAVVRNWFEFCASDGSAPQPSDISAYYRGAFTPQFYPRRFVIKDAIYQQRLEVLSILLNNSLHRYGRAGVRHVELSLGSQDAHNLAVLRTLQDCTFSKALNVPEGEGGDKGRANKKTPTWATSFGAYCEKPKRQTCKFLMAFKRTCKEVPRTGRTAETLRTAAAKNPRDALAHLKEYAWENRDKLVEVAEAANEDEFLEKLFPKDIAMGESRARSP